MTLISKKQSGFTLIELLLYVAASAIILMAVSVFMAILLESRVKNQTISEVDQQGIQIMQIITQAIYNADSVSTPSIGLSGSSLVLDTVSPITFDSLAGVLRIKEGSGPLVPLSNSKVSVSNLSFANLSKSASPGIIKISFALSYINNSGRNEYSFSKNFTSAAALRQP